jgi:prepilin-type N-terminal cleavage/methylation domain-containing protein
MRHGFTLVEVLVALIIFQIAMLALAGTTAVAARDLTTAHRGSRAQILARNRTELHRARICPAPAMARVIHPGGYTETWTIEAVQSLRRIVVTVEFPLPGNRIGRASASGSTLCAP